MITDCQSKIFDYYKTHGKYPESLAITRDNARLLFEETKLTGAYTDTPWDRVADVGNQFMGIPLTIVDLIL